MADSRACSNVAPHKFHGWSEPKPDAGSPNVRVYHVCPGVMEPHDYTWDGSYASGEFPRCAVCGRPEPEHA